MAKPIGPGVDLFTPIKLIKQYEKALKRQAAAIEKGGLRALKKALKSGKTDASKEIRAVIRLKKKIVDQRIQTKVISAKDLTGSLQVHEKRVELIEFTARQKKTGVSVRLWKNKGQTIVHGAFINRGLKTGKLHVMIREPGAGRYPARILYGPSLLAAFKKNEAKFLKTTSEKFESFLSHEIDYALSKVK